MCYVNVVTLGVSEGVVLGDLSKNLSFSQKPEVLILQYRTLH